MRYYIIVMSAITLAACSGNRSSNDKQPYNKAVSIPPNDTFTLEFNNTLRIPEGIYLDTISRTFRSGGKETILLPRIRDKSLSLADKVLVQEIQRRLQAADVKQVGHASKEVKHWTMTTEPVSLYKSATLISYAFISVYSDPDLMRPFRTYISVNYDVKQRRLLQVNDYFNTRTPADTSLLSYIIYAAVGERENTYWQYNQYDTLVDFAVDADKLYFYFDQFSAGGNPCGLEGSAKKKYFLNLIRNEYR